MIGILGLLKIFKAQHPAFFSHVARLIQLASGVIAFYYAIKKLFSNS
jgi:hypothetical protein